MDRNQIKGNFNQAWSNITSFKLDMHGSQKSDMVGEFRGVFASDSKEEIIKNSAKILLEPNVAQMSIVHGDESVEVFLDENSVFISSQGEYFKVPEFDREEFMGQVPTSEFLDDLNKIFEFIEIMDINENENGFLISYDNQKNSSEFFDSIQQKMKQKDPSIVLNDVFYEVSFNKDFLVTSLKSTVSITKMGIAKVEITASIDVSDYNMYDDLSTPLHVIENAESFA